MDLIRLLTNRKEKPYDRKRVDKTLGPWSAFKGPSAECIPGTRLPRKIVWHRPRLLFGRKREEIDFAIGVMTHWLRLEPKLMRFIAYFLRDTEKYKVREIPRPGREPRRIEEPMALLKFVQRRILRRILEQTDLPDCVHGFVRGRSIGTAAAPHAHKEVVVCCDIENFSRPSRSGACGASSAASSSTRASRISSPHSRPTRGACPKARRPAP